jgi:hypothetical protein
MKKGDLSIQVIVVAAIALIVLVVLIVIFTGRMGTWGTQSANCELKGGKCAVECGNAQYGTTDFPIPFTDKCPTEGDKCCIKGAVA